VTPRPAGLIEDQLRENTLTAPDATNLTPIEATIVPTPMRFARYDVLADGSLADRGSFLTQDGELAIVKLSKDRVDFFVDFCVDAIARERNDLGPVAYTSTTARSAAAQLLGYVHRIGYEPQPEPIRTTLLEPDTRTASSTTWQLGSGLALHYTTPDGASLTAENTEWTLTTDLATRWARALLALAAELDHARAVWVQAILAQRTRRTPTESIRRWLDHISPDLTIPQLEFVDRLRDVLSDEESIARDETLIAALDIAHPDLPTSLADLRLFSRETITHQHAADVIGQLARYYALPMYLWTADSWYIGRQINDQPLTEQEWLRVGRTPEMNGFGEWIQDTHNNGGGLDILDALHQAGVLCRVCDARITGEITATLGLCDDCRPDDPAQALAKALAAGCPGGTATHVLSSGGSCGQCGLPLPDDYHLVLEAERAEQQQRDAAWRAEAAKRRKVMDAVRQLIAQDAAKTAELVRQRQCGELSAAQSMTLDAVRSEAIQVPVEDVIVAYLGRAEAVVEQDERAAGDAG
jgi:hypothetical protein